MDIQNCTIGDIEKIFEMYETASNYQRSINATVVWPTFERSLVEAEIAENRQWKLLIDGTIACVWATTYSDEQIWEERNADPAVYIHRIATNPAFRRQNLVSVIVSWAKNHGRHLGKDYVRLDTLGNNQRLISHYTGAGFTFLGMFTLARTDGLPAHYGTAPACLFQLRIDGSDP
ncbi:MAG: family N-acetyltransferase [Flaviaesturariibacter sp.]|nr:family N-acetyltransferase [Flaviaesturariibacter sp.]